MKRKGGEIFYVNFYDIARLQNIICLISSGSGPVKVVIFQVIVIFKFMNMRS